MSFEADLIKTYDTLKDNAPAELPDIAPVCHHYVSCNKSIVDVKISEDSSLIDISYSKEEKQPIIIPVTEKSAARTSNATKTPHALNDYLQFMSPQFTDKKNDPYGAYMSQLSLWNESSHACPQAKAVYDFLEGNDLLDIIEKSSSASLNPADSIDKLKKVFVRWSVVMPDAAIEPRTWMNKDVRDSWTAYYTEWHKENSPKDIDCISGELVDIEEKHPKLNRFGNAKLISTKDDIATGFNYIGERFHNETQIAQIGYINSCKMFNALDWLLMYQSIPVRASDTDYLMCWQPEAETNNAEKLLNDIFGNTDKGPVDYIDQTGVFADFLNGRSDLMPKEGVSIAIMSSSGTGRCSPVMYRSVTAKSFLDNIRKWYSSCNMYRYDFNEKKNRIFSPSIYGITRAAFGSIIEGKLSVTNKADFSYSINALINAVIDGRPIPRNIADHMYQQASNPLKFKKNEAKNKLGEWYFEVLPIACAVLHSEHLQQKKGDKDMTLDRENNDRSYLFGRILAVLEKIESDAISKKNGTSRMPNAITKFKAFSTSPFSGYKMLTECAMPYLAGLGQKAKTFYDKEIGSIVSLFTTNDPEVLNRPLGPDYLLGYYNEKTFLYTKKTKDSETDNTETENNKEEN